MAMKQLCLTLLASALVIVSLAKQQPCLTSASNCDECIQSGPQCAWCTAPKAKIRCHTLKGLQSAGCQKRHLYNPQGRVQVVRNESSTQPAAASALLLQPQELSLHLRPGVSQSFSLVITTPTDQPITEERMMDTSSVPAGVNITFSSTVNENLQVVQVIVEAAQCKTERDDLYQNRTGPWSVFITPRGSSQSLKLELTLECECECMREQQEGSTACSGQGTLQCGLCRCYEHYIGQYCQVSIFFPQNDDYCRPSPGAAVCSGRGDCLGDACSCYIRANPTERYSGRYCECSNFDCLRSNNRMCGGHGRCECGECLCDKGWAGEDCSCSLDTTACLAANQQVCSGRGSCECGQCRCETPQYTGPTCESCPTCENVCTLNLACVECRAFGKGEKKSRCDEECNFLTVTLVDTKGDLPPPRETGGLCKMRSTDDSCFFYFTFSRVSPTTAASFVVKAKEC